ncbi:MAG TPA: polysaccharide biosynthesis tyrosine autokinase [Dehalococcoidia bacterium]
MTLRDYLVLARKWWWLVAACAAIGAAAAYGVRSLQPPSYQAHATLLVNQVQTPGTVAYNDVLASERLAETYRRMVISRPVLEDAQESLQIPGGPEALAGRLTVDAVPDTQLIRLSARAGTPEEAARIANGVVDTVLERNSAGEFGTAGSLAVVEGAVPPSSPSGNRAVLMAVLGMVLGAVVGGGTAVLVESLDDRVRDPDRVRRLGLPLLGTVYHTRRIGKSVLISRDEPDAPAAEAYRVVRTAVQFALLDREWRTLLVTSAQEGEGKTTTAANLAVVAAQAGRRVVAVDADLRRPALHEAFGLGNRAGLTDLLLQRDARLETYLQATDVAGCAVLTSGPLLPTPDALLASARLRDVLAEAAAAADLVVIDGPPVLPVADAGYLAHLADGTILVLDARTTRHGPAARAVATLRHAGATVVGAVLNRVRDREAYGYYGYQSAPAPAAARPSPNGARPDAAEAPPRASGGRPRRKATGRGTRERAARERP